MTIDKELYSLMTVKEYAKIEGVSVNAIYLRIKRGKLSSEVRYNVTLVIPQSDMTIKKPRK